MKNVDKYLKLLHEQFDGRIALEDISGDFKDEWTDCYEVKCHRQTVNKYEKNVCRADCQIRAAMKAISRINAAKSKCTSAPEPNRCVKSLERGVIMYQNKIERFKEAQKNAQNQFRAFQSKTGA